MKVARKPGRALLLASIRPHRNTLSFREEEICQTCFPGVTIESLYQSYTAKAERVFSFKCLKEPSPTYLGVELELEDRTIANLLSTWRVLKDHAIIKRDGSVSGGIEICSAPATIAIHKEEFKSFFAIVDKIKLHAKDNCGMHVHVDRAKLSELQIGKMLSFFYNKDNKTFINKIAGRKDNSYCTLDQERKMGSGVFFDTTKGGSYTKQLVRKQTEGRYTGLNLTPSATIEFRIFASTTDYNKFVINLEFVQSMVDFTRGSALTVKSIKDFSEKKVYLSFLVSNKKEYPNLYTFVKENLPKELQGCN